MRTVRELVWLTQLGLSIVCPLLLPAGRRLASGPVWLRKLGYFFGHCPGFGRRVFRWRCLCQGCELFEPTGAGKGK